MEEGEALNPLATAMEAEAERERQAATALGAMLRLSIWRSMNRGERRADATSGDEELSPLPAVFCRP